MNSLRLFTGINSGAGFVANLPRDNWKRTIRLQGGYWQGSLTIAGELRQLIQPFYDWMAYHVSELSGGVVTWEGLVYELELAYGGSRRKRTLDLMSNAVKTTFTTMDFSGPNLIANAGFESLGGGGSDVYAAWEEASSGVANNTSSPHGGSNCCRLTSDGVRDSDGHFTNRYIRQNCNIQAGHQYKLTFWNRGDGSRAPNYSIRNPNSPVYWIVAPTQAGSKSTTWEEKSMVFEGPSGGEVLIFFYPPAPSGNYGDFDDAELLEKTEVIYETPFSTEDQSIARYGRKEDVLELDNYPLDTAEWFRDTYLTEHAYPWARPLGVGGRGPATLTITACGYVFTANWQYATVGDGTQDDLDLWLAALVGSEFGLDEAHGGTVDGAGDCEFLKVGNIQSNDLEVIQRITGRDRVWDLIAEMVALGDQAGAPYRAYVDNGRLFHYNEIDLTPAYYQVGDRILDRLGARVAVNPYLVRPGVVRDMNFPVRRSEQGSMFADARDTLIDEVEVDGAGNLALKSALLSETDIYSAQFADREWQYPEFGG